MADYIAQFRSNRFRVKNDAAFEQEFLPRLFGEDIQHDKNKEGRHILYGYGSIPDWVQYENDNASGSIVDATEKDFLAELALYLAEDEVAVFQEVGFEKFRYLSGHAVAVNSKGDLQSVHLDDIYYHIEKEWDKKDTTACSY